MTNPAEYECREHGAVEIERKIVKWDGRQGVVVVEFPGQHVMAQAKMITEPNYNDVYLVYGTNPEVRTHPSVLTSVVTMGIDVCSICGQEMHLKEIKQLPE